jgi:hypothetical protein
VRAERWVPIESGTLGDDPRVLPRHKVPVVGTAPLRRTPSPEQLTALGAMARWGLPRSGPRLTSRFRTETGLAPKTATGGIAPAGAVRWIVPLQ